MAKGFNSAAAGGGVAIKSLQRGASGFGNNGALVNDIVISAVDLTKAIVVSKGNTWSGIGDKNLQDNAVTMKLTSPTNLRITRQQNDASFTVSYEIVEFEGAIIQTGDEAISGTSGSLVRNVTIDAVDLEKTQVFFTFNTSTTDHWFWARITLTSITNIQIVVTHFNNSTTNVTWYIVEI